MTVLLLRFLPALLMNTMVLNRPLTIRGPIIQKSAKSIPFFRYEGEG